MVRALLETRAVGEPDDEPEDEAEDRTDDTDDRAVRADDETDVAVGGAGRLEHPDRAHAALREHREAADRDERDEQHAEDQCGERDRLGVERIRLRDRGRGLHLYALPIELSETPGASNNAVTPVGFVTCPGATSANSSRRLWGFSTMPTTWRSTPPTRQVAPTVRWNADATPLVTATWSAPDGKCPETSESIGPLKGPCGSCARS